MKIRTRLSIAFSSIASAMFIAFAVTVFFFSKYHRSEDFQERLSKRIEITEKIFLEKESFSPEELAKINDQFLHTLTEETEEVVEIVNGQQPEFKHEYPDDFISSIQSPGEFNYENSIREGRAKLFNVKGKNYLIIVTATDVVGYDEIGFLKQVLLLLVLAAIPFIFLGSFILTKRELSPLYKKIQNANTIGASNLDQRLSVYNPNDEIGQMAIAFNGLLERLESSFDAQKSFIRNASHEIKNPLTAIMGETEVTLSKVRTPEEYEQTLKVVLSEVEGLDATVNNLLQLSKVLSSDEGVKLESICLNEFLMEVKKGFDFLNPQNEIIVEVEESAEGLKIRGNKNLLKTALLNIMDNACKFSENKLVQVKLSGVVEMLHLSVEDRGIGIKPEELGKVLTPFYRGYNTLQIKGSGIGLSLTARIIELHQGKFTLESREKKGTTVVIKLPINHS